MPAVVDIAETARWPGRPAEQESATAAIAISCCSKAARSLYWDLLHDPIDPTLYVDSGYRALVM